MDWTRHPAHTLRSNTIPSSRALIRLLTAPPNPLYIAPAWIDLQVNGYAAVDYNSPVTPIEEIARSVDVLNSTGTGRFYPTVITGPAEDMVGSLRNLAQGEGIAAFH